MKSVRHLMLPKSKFSFNVPLAGWVLSAITFLVGTVVTPIYQRATFDGISISQQSGFSLSQSKDGTFELKSTIKIANTTTTAIAIEDMGSDLPALSPVPLERLGYAAHLVKDGESPEPKPNLLSRDEDLPLIVKPASIEIFAVQLAFKSILPPGSSASEVSVETLNSNHERLFKELKANGFQLKITINGKLRQFRVFPASSRHHFE